MTTPVPNLVRDALAREGAYDFGLGVILRAPTDPSGTGGSASYRVEYRIEPVIPGRPKAARRYRYARDLGEAFALAQATFEQMQQRAAGTFVEYHTDVLFGQVGQRWGEQYPDKVRSLLRNWLLADRITVAWQPGAPPARLADLPIGAITADPIKWLELIQKRLDLEERLSDQGVDVDLAQLEADFVAAAAGYAERKGISYSAFRESGVPAATLKAAGIRRTRKS
jgi:hypothetical protein